MFLALRADEFLDTKIERVNGIQVKKKHRGISQVIGSLLLLAIVVPIGTVILINGTSQINAFNNEMSTTVSLTNKGIREDIVFEHVRFDPPSREVTITLRNIGSVETVIDRITLVNMTNQEILYKIDDMSGFVPIVIPVKNNADISFEANPQGGTWNGGDQTGKEYKISIITARGNFFDTIARPYNT